eukprot:scaffold1992_cov187-Amphora_coffeaeformis.AAC.35
MAATMRSFNMTTRGVLLLLFLWRLWQPTAAFCPTTTRIVPAPVSTTTTTTPTRASNLPPRSSRLFAAAISAKKVQTAMSSNNAVRGNLMIFLSKFMVAPSVYAEVVRKILMQTYIPELILIGAMTQAMPVAAWIFRWRHPELVPDDDDKEDKTDKKKDNHEFEEAFEASLAYKLGRVIQQVGLLQAILYTSDVFLVALKHLDFKCVVKCQAQRRVGSIIMVCWSAWNASRLKNHYLNEREFSWKGQKKTVVDTNGVVAQNRFLSRLADVFIYACSGLTVIDLLGVEIGFAIKSIFGLGSFGTLALSLASKDLAAEFVGGLMIQTSNFFDEGEQVTLQDGTKGTVAKIGWLVSVVRNGMDG